MTAMTNMLHWFWRLPRAAQWLTFAIVFTVLFLAWHSVLGEIAANWNASADTIEADVRTVRNSREVLADLKRLGDPITAIGEVATPGGKNEGGVAMSNAVIEIMGTMKYSFGLNASGGNLPQDISRSVSRGGQRLSRLTGDLKFEATPEKAVDIIAAFETHPDIEAVSSVRLTRSSAGKLTVRLTLEAWVVAEKTTGGR